MILCFGDQRRRVTLYMIAIVDRRFNASAFLAVSSAFILSFCCSVVLLVSSRKCVQQPLLRLSAW